MKKFFNGLLVAAAVTRFYYILKSGKPATDDITGARQRYMGLYTGEKKCPI